MQKACQIGSAVENQRKKFIFAEYGKADFLEKKKAFLTEGLSCCLMQKGLRGR
jgi:hypothetical protein